MPHRQIQWRRLPRWRPDRGTDRDRPFSQANRPAREISTTSVDIFDSGEGLSSISATCGRLRSGRPGPDSVFIAIPRITEQLIEGRSNRGRTVGRRGNVQGLAGECRIKRPCSSAIGNSSSGLNGRLFRSRAGSKSPCQSSPPESHRATPPKAPSDCDRRAQCLVAPIQRSFATPASASSRSQRSKSRYCAASRHKSSPARSDRESSTPNAARSGIRFRRVARFAAAIPSRSDELCRTSPLKKHGARSAVRTPDETVWGLRASDIYQGGETEPLPADRAYSAALQSLDNEFAKNYSEVVALSVRTSSKIQTRP